MKKIACALVALLFASATAAEAWQNENTRKICEEMAAKIGVASEKMDDYMRACVDGKNPAGGRLSGDDSENGAGRGKSRRAAVSRSGKGTKAGKRGKTEKTASGASGKASKASAGKADAKSAKAAKTAPAKGAAATAKSTKPEIKATPAKGTPASKSPAVKPASATPANAKAAGKDAKKKP